MTPGPDGWLYFQIGSPGNILIPPLKAVGVGSPGKGKKLVPSPFKRRTRVGCSSHTLRFHLSHSNAILNRIIFSSRSMARGIAQKKPAITSAAWYSMPRAVRVSSRLRPDFCKAKLFGAALPMCRSRRMDRCWCPMTSPVQSIASATKRSNQQPSRSPLRR